MRLAIATALVLVGVAGAAGQNSPPDCSDAAATVPQLWPPNHKFVGALITGVTDSDGDGIMITITAIAQDEPVVGVGDGATCPDGGGVGLAAVRLRAERSGRGDGRVYHVGFRAADGAGGFCDGEVQVCVRHDRRPGGRCGDQGALHDSTAGAPPCSGDDCEAACVPRPDDPLPKACAGAALPDAVARRLVRARDLLAGSPRRRQVLRAVRQLQRAAAAAGTLPAGCAAALRDRLDEAARCVVCRTSGDD